MGSSTAEFVVDVLFSTTHALRVVWKVLPRALGRALHYKVGAQHVLSHCSAAKCAFFLKKGDVNKKSAVSRGICRLYRRDPELNTLVYLLLMLQNTDISLYTQVS